MIVPPQDQEKSGKGTGAEGTTTPRDRWDLRIYPFFPGILPLTKLYWRLRMVGAVDTIPSQGPLIIVSNHASFLDPWITLSIFPRTIRYLINYDWYTRSRFWNRLFRGMGTEPLRPGNPRETINAVCRLLARGEVVGIYPEGRISYDGRINPFRRGLSLIAAKSGAPVIPMGIRGSFTSMPRHHRFPRPRRITIHLGEPVRFPGAPHAGAPSRKETRWFRERIVREICRLAGQEDRVDALLNTPKDNGLASNQGALRD